MEVSVIAERKEIEFQGFAFHQFVIRDIADDNAAEIRLACFRAKACKFRAVQLDQIRRFLMLIGESFQDRRIIGTFIFRMAAAKSGHTGKFFFVLIMTDLSSFGYEQILYPIFQVCCKAVESRAPLGTCLAIFKRQ